MTRPHHRFGGGKKECGLGGNGGKGEKVMERRRGKGLEALDKGAEVLKRRRISGSGCFQAEGGKTKVLGSKRVKKEKKKLLGTDEEVML